MAYIYDRCNYSIRTSKYTFWYLRLCVCNVRFPPFVLSINICRAFRNIFTIEKYYNFQCAQCLIFNNIDFVYNYDRRLSSMFLMLNLKACIRCFFFLAFAALVKYNSHTFVQSKSDVQYSQSVFRC